MTIQHTGCSSEELSLMPGCLVFQLGGLSHFCPYEFNDLFACDVVKINSNYACVRTSCNFLVFCLLRLVP